jgi:mRNA-degrading endonuclease RelE of RelBE toxin-antitoxin system
VYHIRILDAATRELARLDKPVGRRVVKRIRWLAANLNDLVPESLTGDLAGFYKLRVGGLLYSVRDSSRGADYRDSGVDRKALHLPHFVPSLHSRNA